MHRAWHWDGDWLCNGGWHQDRGCPGSLFPYCGARGSEIPARCPQQLWLVPRSLLVHTSKAKLGLSKMPHCSLPFGRGFESEASKKKNTDGWGFFYYLRLLRPSITPPWGCCRALSSGVQRALPGALLCRWADFKLSTVQTVITKRGDQQQPCTRHGDVCVQSTALRAPRESPPHRFVCSRFLYGTCLGEQHK